MTKSLPTKIAVLETRVSSIHERLDDHFKDEKVWMGNIDKKLENMQNISLDVAVLKSKDAQKDKDELRSKGILGGVMATISAVIAWITSSMGGH